MKFSIDNNDLQGKINREEQIIICDAAGNLYEVIRYIKPKEENDEVTE
jgi:hypothetical protein